MKKAIAMKCNQEQFDAVKGKLNGMYSMIGNFSNFPYLITEYYDREEHISNTKKSNRFKGHDIYETWNEQIFLEACGIETEKIFKGSELQIRDSIGNWFDCCSDETFRLKPNNSAEIEALEQQKLEIEKQIEKLR